MILTNVKLNNTKTIPIVFSASKVQERLIFNMDVRNKYAFKWSLYNLSKMIRLLTS